MSLLSVRDLDLRGRRVFIRCDFNVPLKTTGGKTLVADPGRIEAAIPTINFVTEQGGKCILASHLGRPEGKPNPKYSLEPVAQYLSERLKRDVLLTEDCVGDGPKGLAQQLKQGDILLLENLRFNPGEEANAPEFANRLAELCDVYVTDAFGTLHRAHASTSALPKLVSKRGMGFLVEKELKYLQPLRDNPKRPFVLITGGAKVSDKIGVIDHFLPKVDKVIIGGAMAYAFLKAMGHEVGKSLCDDKQVSIAGRLIASADARNVKLYLPEDHVVTYGMEDSATTVTIGRDIPEAKMGVDIGPKSLKSFAEALKGAELIFWNGPMGVFEKPAFANGTFEMAKMIAASGAQKMAGGGDSAAAIHQSGTQDSFDFISTGGGATLEYLEGLNLPGLQALESFERPTFAEDDDEEMAE